MDTLEDQNASERKLNVRTKKKMKAQTESESQDELALKTTVKANVEPSEVQSIKGKVQPRAVQRMVKSKVNRVAYRLRSYGFFERPPWIKAMTFVIVCATATALGVLAVIAREIINYETRPVNELTSIDNWYEAKWNGFKYSLTFQADSSLEWHHMSAVDWYAAKALCLARQSQLVYISDSDEQSFLLTFIHDAAKAHQIPIPGQDRKALSFWTAGIVRVDPSIVFYNKWPFKQLMWDGVDKAMTFHHHCKFTPEEVFVEGHTFALMFNLYNDPHRYLGCWMASHPKRQKFFPLCKASL